MNKELKAKITRILVDYKYNQTRIETTAMLAERIINIIKTESKHKLHRTK
jgi:hypothetical protein